MNGYSGAASTWRLATVGTIAGVAWAASLRSYMWQIGTDHDVTWAGTFYAILASGGTAGALLGWAEARRRAGRTARLRWFALAPFTFAVFTMSLPGQLAALFQNGLGGGAIGVPMLAVLGGFALGTTGPRWARIVSGVLAVAFTAGIVATVPTVGGYLLALNTPRGLWTAILVGTLMILAALASSIPFRPLPAPPDPPAASATGG
ncbi:hypothetical protein [Demequina soli]|uniref:hypothetical protein n=1 Tax=Demequina soli TaxID=1638987 RepID=UPI000783A2B1|nr:hypothetical protein [Demequina soli]